MKVQMLKELPINDDIITADVFLGYVAQMSLESIESIERPIALHLILKTADNMTKYTPEQVEPIFETRKEVIYQNKSGFKALLQWFFSKRRIRRTNLNSIVDKKTTATAFHSSINRETSYRVSATYRKRTVLPA